MAAKKIKRPFAKGPEVPLVVVIHLARSALGVPTVHINGAAVFQLSEEKLDQPQRNAPSPNHGLQPVDTRRVFVVPLPTPLEKHPAASELVHAE